MPRSSHAIRPYVRVCVLLLTIGLVPSLVRASTLAPKSITTNTTWTVQGSPYIVAPYTIVQAGVTLTIEPGVIIKFGGGIFTNLAVYGNLTAVGSAANRITFTSIQDDSVGGDTGGDGATLGAPGQWSSIEARGPTLTFDYVDVKFGGYGSSNTSYGALTLYAGSANIDHTRVTFSQRAGLRVTGTTDVANVAHGDFSSNAVGISIQSRPAQIHANTRATYNSDTGIYMLFLANYTGVPASVLNSDVINNAAYGIRLVVESGISASSVPYGHMNNIYQNGFSGPDKRQLNSFYPLAQSDWTNNYWGPIAEKRACPWASGNVVSWQLVYQSQPDYCKAPPAGPVQWTNFVLPGCENNKPMQCGADYVNDDLFAATPFDNSGL